MSDKMRMVPFTGLIDRMMEEWRHTHSVYDIIEADFYRKDDDKIYEVFGEKISVPLGPAAGPHSQIAQNIVASYLTGSRFIELKTVQVLDGLEIDKPCIDMTDEGFNTEWSTELTLGQAWEEYAKAWILLHLVERLFLLGHPDLERSFVFNISVGYDLTGIKTAKMERYIERMKDSSKESRFQGWLLELDKKVNDPDFLKGTGLEDRRESLKDLSRQIPATIVRSVSLSTMHGCPPNEIESICRYMIDEKGLDTYVKLNPTLLGFDKVRGILDGLGFRRVELTRESFEHDLQWEDARFMLARLEQFGQEKGQRFGVKLTNTLGSVNNRKELPGDEMYMSGRSLYPLTVAVATLISAEFDGRLPISYSGGVSIHNATKLLAVGIRPITLATDLLKPGGYSRQKQIAVALEPASGGDLPHINVAALEALAQESKKDPSSLKAFRGDEIVSHKGSLPLSDCYVAPCVSACAIEQHIPEYIRLVGQERYADALSLIYERNALPSITGSICDHQCEIHCTRMDYDGALSIREVKLVAVEKGMEEWRARWKTPIPRQGPKVAVIGAGPAGLSAAFFLAREGISVTVFEKEPDAGGVVRYVVPHFRISREAIDSDIDIIKAMGAKFCFNQQELSVSDLKEKGYEKVILGVGTWATQPLPIEGDSDKIFPAIRFLYDFNKGKISPMGKTVVTIGAGDTAMDAARSALRVPGVEKSIILYRRTFEQMPASKEEYEDAIADGVKFIFLRSPERYDKNGKLLIREMELGEEDASGRRRPLPTDRTETWDVGTLLYAIGDEPDPDNYEELGVTSDERGRVVTDSSLMSREEGVYVIGDGRTGPSTIVRCIAEGRKVSDALMTDWDSSWLYDEKVPSWPVEQRNKEIRQKKARVVLPILPPYDRDNPKPFTTGEMSRCIECDTVCDKCVDVCPNRANIVIPVDPFQDPYFNNQGQIVHIDAYCNECGNCGHFCPWTEGVPYKDKPTVFSTNEDFLDSSNPGWFLDGEKLHWRLGDALGQNIFREGEIKKIPLLEGADRFFHLFKMVYSDRPSLFGEVDTRTPEELEA